MMRILKYVLAIVFCSYFQFNSAQETRVDLGNKYYSQLDYEEAIDLFEGAKKRGKGNLDLYAKLGDSYFKTSRPEKAVENFQLASIGDKNKKASFMLNFALSLQSIGKRDEAKLMFDKYYAKVEMKEEYKKVIHDDAPNNYSLDTLPINSKFSDFGSFILNDTLYFSSSRENPDKKKWMHRKLYKWNREPYLDIYAAAPVSKIDSIRVISSDSTSIAAINTIAHEAEMVLSSSGDTIYFSGADIKNKNKMAFNKRGTSNLKLKRVIRSENNWRLPDSLIENLKFVDFENYSVGSPALSHDNKRLFFVTCAPFPEAKGKSDIYYVDILPDGTYGKVTNLESLNTAGRESFPYISKDGSLYYSSDGVYYNKPSHGLLDIYKVENINAVIDGAQPKIIHLGKPFNSAMDDFAFYLDQNPDTGEINAYFSSNRPNSTPEVDDDIYRVRIRD